MTSIRFCFDFISPYAYLAWHRIQNLCDPREVELEVVPVLFAAMLNHHGQRGPAEMPAKRLYVFKDAFRTAHLFGLPLVPPPSHPFRPLLALRATGLTEGATQRRLVDALFKVAWGGERHDEGGLESPVVVARVADGAGLSGDDLVERASGEEAKARLRDATADAIGHGVFGVPTLLVGDARELFWGVDSLGHVERFLDGKDPLNAEALVQWEALPASAQRPGSK